MTTQEMVYALSPKVKLEVLTIVDGRFSDSGNYLGITKEKHNGHAPLFIHEKQMATCGWFKHLDNVELSFAALGFWQEVPNKPDSMRFTASIIYRTMQDLQTAIKEEYDLNK